jgi:hypothetical protein
MVSSFMGNVHERSHHRDTEAQRTATTTQREEEKDCHGRRSPIRVRPLHPSLSVPLCLCVSVVSRCPSHGDSP